MIHARAVPERSSRTAAENFNFLFEFIRGASAPLFRLNPFHYYSLFMQNVSNFV